MSYYNIREEDIIRIIKRFLARLGARKDRFLQEYAIYKDPERVVKLEFLLKEYGLLETSYGQELLNFVRKIEKARFIRELSSLERLSAFTSSVRLNEVKKIKLGGD